MKSTTTQLNRDDQPKSPFVPHFGICRQVLVEVALVEGVEIAFSQTVKGVN